MTGWKLQIGAAGTDYSSQCEWDSVTINQTARHKGSTMAFNVTIMVTGGVPTMPRPKAFQEVKFSRINADLSLTTIFGGIILQSEQSEVGMGIFAYRIQSIDFTKWLDHMITGWETYPSEGRSDAADQIAVEIMQNYVLGNGAQVRNFNYIGVDTNPAVPITVASYPTGNVYPSKIHLITYVTGMSGVSTAIDNVAKMADALWFIDPDKKFWFADSDVARDLNITQLLAPLKSTTVTIYDETFDGGSVTGNKGKRALLLPTLDVDNPYANVPDAQATTGRRTTYRNLKILEDVSQTISSIFIYGYEDASTTDTIESPRTGLFPKAATVVNLKMHGDGATRFFPLSNKPVSAKYTTVYFRDIEPGGSTATKTYTVALGNLKTEYVDGSPADQTIVKTSGIASAGTNTTLVTASNLAWGANQWIGYQIYLTGGAGAGQLRTIATNTAPTVPTATTLTVTVTAAWTVNPAASTTFAIFPAGTDWAFVCTSNQGIRFTVAPASTQDIDVWYSIYVPGNRAGTNKALANEIKYREGFGGGYYVQSMADSAYTTGIKDSETLPASQAAVDIQLRRFARFKYTARFESLLTGWRPGQQLAIVSQLRGDTVASPTGYAVWDTTFSQRFFVTGVEQTCYAADGTMLSVIQASSDIDGS